MNAVVKKCSIQISGVSQYTPEQQQKHCEPILLTYTVTDRSYVTSGRILICILVLTFKMAGIVSQPF